MNSNNKKRLITLIQVGRNQLGMDSDTFSRFKWNNVNKNSLTKCNERELNLLLNALKAKGFIPKPKKSNRGPRHPFKLPNDKAALITKIRAQLAEGSYPELYAEQILGNMRRRAGKPEGPIQGNYVSNPLAMASMDELHKVIAALYYNARRKGLKTR